ncbi:hypothetical protein KR200_008629 [Drosophila serrata]|nr:hypothetical protein KR200_008629 [Drosophila serrata]
MTVQSSKLLLKQMPCSLEELAQLIQECRLIVPRTLNSYGRKRALLEYGDAHEAAKALEQLQGLSEQLDKPLSISAFGPRANPAAGQCNKATQTAKEAAAAGGAEKKDQEPEINKYVRRLYACNNHCDFTQPPPPYLGYSYPPINPEILARIGQQLQVNKRFYNQVLHLMNRMNLEPPFQKRSSSVLLIKNHQNVATQTEVVPSDTESELESDDDQLEETGKTKAKRQRLLPTVASEKILKRTRHMLQQAAAQQGGTHSNSQTETPKATFKASKIELKLPETLTPIATKPKIPVTHFSSCLEKRLTANELQALPIYKNYKLGEPSNKLYIKNLDKSVDELQLRELYSRFTAATNLDIKVMQQGRMKGQAFVTFLNEANASEVIAQALSETNGLVWHLKPMIVCYGKQQ